MQQKGPFYNITSSPLSSPIFEQETQPLPLVTHDITPLSEKPSPLVPLKPSSKKRFTRIVASMMTLLLAAAIYVIWFAAPSSSSSSSSSLSTGISQQSFSSSSQNSNASTPIGGNLRVYVIGSVRHPGVYTLPSGARVYQLLLVAGGALPQADLVSLNLAATLNDGQEVYVLAMGESPPTYLGGVPGPNSSGTPTTGQAININTASVDEIRLALHISSSTAQKIVDYRTQHGPYTSIDQLLQVVSRSIYDKIKTSLTV